MREREARGEPPRRVEARTGRWEETRPPRAASRVELVGGPPLLPVGCRGRVERRPHQAVPLAHGVEAIVVIAFHGKNNKSGLEGKNKKKNSGPN